MYQHEPPEYITSKCYELVSGISITTIWLLTILEMNNVGVSLSKQLLWLYALHAPIMSWIASVYEWRLCMTFTWSDLNPVYIIWWFGSSLPLWLVRSCCDKQEVRCCACLNLSRLCYGCQCCILLVAQHCPSPMYWGHLLCKCIRTFSGNI